MSQAQPREHAEQIEDLVAECLMRLEDGASSIPFEEICRDAPELIDEVRSAVEVAGGFQRLQKAGPGSDPLIGELLVERYRVSERIGSGAMGVVYGASDLELSREVAIKVVHTKLLDRGKALARFEREAAALAAIRHDAVVTVYDRGITTDGSPFLVMERVDGVPCSDILEAARERGGDDDSSWLTEKWGIANVSEPSYFRQAVQWAASLASGLEAAHAAGVYHRDVKPSNVMITREGKAILLDFGIAAKDDHATLTQTDAAVGTPVYMAPEALLGRTKAKPTQDVYSLAATLYHFLTFQAPYQGSSAEVLTALATREPIPAFKVRPGLPRDAQAILDHGLARNPANRYQSAASMEVDLRAMLAFRPVSVRPTSTLVRAVRRFRSSKVLLGAVAATVLIASVFGVRAVRSHLDGRRQRAFQEAMPHVIANLGIVNLSNRVIRDANLRAVAEADLDRLVLAGHDPVTERVLRAAFLLDHGRIEAATDDMRVACNAAGTAFASELLTRYEALQADAASAKSLDLEDLPQPQSADDTYLAAYHLLRDGQLAPATELLDDVRLSEHVHAQYLALVLKTLPLKKLFASGEFDELYVQAEALYRATEELERNSGIRSATTCHLKATARLRQGMYAESLELGRAGLELAPASHVMIGNAALCLRELVRLEEAKEMLDRGLEITPGYLSFQHDLAKVYASQGRADEARDLVAIAAFPSTSTGDRQRLQLAARVELRLAQHYFDTDRELSSEFARRAIEFAQQLRDTDELKRMVINYSAGLLEDSNPKLVTASLIELNDDPMAIEVARTLVKRMDAPLTNEQQSYLRSWIAQLTELRSRTSRLAPGR